MNQFSEITAVPIITDGGKLTTAYIKKGEKECKRLLHKILICWRK